jgi:DNA polymerase
LNTKGRISEIAAEVRSCSKCRLSDEATRGVPGEGNPDAEAIILGEGPGREEDEQGRPFVGRGGQKLDEIMRSASVSRESVFITNVVKHRPPDNRNPRSDEVQACRPFLKAQISAIDPSIILTLGNTATREILDTREGITSIRGEFFSWRDGVRVLPTFHPSYLLRNPSGSPKSPEDQMRDDMLALKKEIASSS